ncbi:hypothetical protein E2C01_072751 [Portunus trituberculatus]|uniref:Uncharacterized protein n=1 Tax=Portunus trituberculatus TaxID=210409 RepID=A0A5B7I9R6_PORTR|nr:hypothetical protein [Portunus trituberculatus]
MDRISRQKKMTNESHIAHHEGEGTACGPARNGTVGVGCSARRRHKSVIGGRSVAEVCISVREPRPNRLAKSHAIFQRAPPPSRGVRSASRGGAAAGPGLCGDPSDSEGTPAKLGNQRTGSSGV